MNRRDPHSRMAIIGYIMTGMGVLGALALVALQVWLSPAQKDVDTGLFANNTLVMILSLLILGGLAAFVFVIRGGPRQEITGKASLGLAVMTLAVGAAIAGTGVVDIWMAIRTPPELSPVETTKLVSMMQWLQRGFCVLGGAALVRLGLSLASEGSTRRGIAQWSLLAPVLWMWFLLANYEMSYASMVRLSDGYFTLMTYVTELLFLFYFARYMAGVGNVGAGTLLLFSAGTVMFSIATPVVRMFMYQLQDGDAYHAAGTTGVLDLAIGLLALTVCITLCRSLATVPVQVSVEEEVEAVDWSSTKAAEPELIEGFEEFEEG